MKYKRIILKLSGETLLPEGKTSGISMDAAKSLSEEIRGVVSAGVEIGIVIGGGNIFRGAAASETGKICQAQADRMGMLATIINGLALQEAMLAGGIDAVLMSSLFIQGVAEPFDRRMAIRNLKNSRVMIFCGGTGSPFFSTDTAAALRALEVDANAILKGTKVDGVYSADPMKDKNATRYDRLSYLDVIKNKLKVMDLAAISMCMEHNIPIVVFDIFKKGNLKRAVGGEELGTVVYG
jgi:uridylate kinase